MAAVTTAPTPPRLFPPESDILNTLPDPRTPGGSSVSSRNDSLGDSLDSIHHPHLNEEIAKISEKLVNAINHQTSLDDSLQQSRHELEIARHHIAQLEAKTREHSELISNGLLVTIADVGAREAKIRAEMETERSLREKAELEKKNMEQELETLTSALFTEANTMVADARKEKEASDRRNDQLRNQLRDAEILLQSHQEQLQDLKGVLERMVSDQEDAESVAPTTSSAPSTPAVAQGRTSRLFESGHFSPPGSEDVAPDAPLHFSHIVKPALRTDIPAYDDFCSVIKTARAASPPSSRVPSGSYGSLNVMSHGPNFNHTSQSPSPGTPNFAVNSGNSSPRTSVVPVQPLPMMRETKLFKRALAEDIEPTLRLDIAPGVSWMIRRAVQNSIIDGSLVVEPMPPPPVKHRGPVNPCALCGENRVGETYSRRHRFRISENSETRRFPLCDLCLGRLRSVGDLLSFLRMVTNGHWKADTEEEMKSAWEEYVKLRERMFWHRISGGVVPVSGHSREGTGSPNPDNIVPKFEDQPATIQTETEDPFLPKELPHAANGTSNVVTYSELPHEPSHADKSSNQADNGPNGSSSTSVTSPSQEAGKLSIAIPGAFQ
jgi:Rab guanine nucleotide exchange factor SEC2